MGVYRWHHHHFSRLFFMVVGCDVSNSLLALGSGEVWCLVGVSGTLWVSFLCRRTPAGAEPTALPFAFLLFFSDSASLGSQGSQPISPLTAAALSFVGLLCLIIWACISQTFGAHWLYDWHIMYFLKLKSFTNFIFFLIFVLYWSLVDLQCHVSFRRTAKWFSETYTYDIYSLSKSFPV